MEAYSMDLRERVMQAYDEGQGSTRQLAEVFDVSSAWIRKLLRLRRETGSIAPIEYQRGPKPKLNERQRERLLALARQHPSMTLKELRRRLRLRCCLMTIHRVLAKEGFTFKRRLSKLASSDAKMSPISVGGGSVG